MKLTNQQILDCVASIREILQMPFPVKTSFEFAKLARTLDSAIDTFNRTRQGLVEAYKITTDIDKKTGQNIIVSRKSNKKEGSADVKKFTSELQALLDFEVELIVNKITLPDKIASTCDKCHHNMDKPLELKPSILLALDKFIEVK